MKRAWRSMVLVLGLAAVAWPLTGCQKGKPGALAGVLDNLKPNEIALTVEGMV